MNITREDVQQLVSEPSPAMRARIVQKITSGYNAGLLNDSETRLANEIFRLLLKDTETKVRRLVAEELKSNMQVPHDIIWALANDKQEVALPVLMHSSVLTEEDLILLVRTTREQPKWLAIAQRHSVSKELAHALIETRQETVAKFVLQNRTAALAETTMALVMEEFARDNSVLEELVMRGGLPVQLAERLFAMVSDTLKKHLTKKYRLSKHVVEEATNSARETAVLQFITPWMSQQEISRLVDQMHHNKRLTDSVLIRSLCIGDLRFFETALAKRVGIPVSNARILALDPGPLGFRALYTSAGMPESFYPAVQVMLRLALDETQYGNYRAADFGARMVERILQGGHHKTVQNMDVLLGMIGRAIQEAPTIH